MESQTASPGTGPVPGQAPALAAAAPDRLGAEVRESALLLVLSVAVTTGIAGGAQALLALVG